MSGIQLFAIEDNGAQPLPTPATVSDFDDLYEELQPGVYSALRTFAHHKFLYLEHHIARTISSMRVLGWDYELDEARLRRTLHQVCAAYPFANARVRFDVLAAPPIHLGTTSRELIGLMPFTPPPPELYEMGVKVDFAPELHRARPLAKTADFAQARRPYRNPSASYEYLLLDEAGCILEGISTNFYGVCNGVLRTAGHGVLEGITRKIVLEQAGQLGIPVHLKPIQLSEIPCLQEAIISGSSRALLPVVQIGQQVVGDGHPGPICHRLLSAYNSFIVQTIKTAIDIS